MTRPLEVRWSSEELQQARRAAELTQAELADRLGVRLWIIDQWESGARAIPADRIDELAEATGRRPEGTPDVALRSEAAAAPDKTQAAAADATMEPVDNMVPLEPDLPRALRGYEPGAVHELLGELAASRELLVKELNAAKFRARQLEEQLPAASDRAVQLEEQLQAGADRAMQLEEQLQAAADRAMQLEEQLQAAGDRAMQLEEQLPAAADRAMQLEEQLQAAEEHAEEAQSRVVQLEEQVQTAEERAVELTGEVPDFREQEDLIRDAIITAQKAANQVRAEARRGASEVLRSARRRAEQIVGEAEKERERLAEELSRLEQLTETSRVTVSKFLSSVLDQVKSEPTAERDMTDAALDEVIFEHEIGKVAETPPTHTDGGGSKRSRSS